MEFMQKNMFFLINSFWSCILHVFSFISRFFFRFSDEVNDENGSDVFEEKADESIVEKPDEKTVYDQINEMDNSSSNNEVGNVCNVGTSKYEFFVGNSVCSFIEEPQIMNFTVHEVFVISNNLSSSSSSIKQNLEDNFPGFSVDLKDESIEHVTQVLDESHILDHHHDICGEFSGKLLVDEHEHEHEHEHDHDVSGELSGKLLVDENDHDICDELSGKLLVEEQGKSEEFVCDPSFEEHELENNDCDDLSRESDVVVDDEDHEKAESFVFSLSCDEQELSSVSQDELSEKEEILSQENGMEEKIQLSDQIHSSISNSDDFWSSIHNYECYIGNNHMFDYDYDEDCGDQSVDYVGDSTPSSFGETSIDGNNCQLDDSSVESDFDEPETQYIELKPEPFTDPTVQNHEQLLKAMSIDSDDELDQESSNLDELKGLDHSENCDGGDVLLEQKELIRRMKKEMRQLKLNGLPTILEESESPRVEDDLRPLRIDERIGHKDRMDEIQTFYKRYLDKMRKLDILSQQTMYAIGLLQLKHQDQLAMNKKVSIPALKSLLAQNFWSHKLRKHETDPVQKLIRDLRNELELVYVGQLCLSWEILKWQYSKLVDLKAHDPDGFRQYNQGAGEFQKFQVLLQRFTEDEPYHQGPRVQHYLKSRCSHPNLLQVPLIKEDPKSEWRGDGEGAISIGTLKEIISASMRSFWDFLRTDKDEVHVVSLMGLHGVHVDLQDPADSDLLTEIRSSLQKREKRLKDLIKSGNCLVRKFQKNQDQRLSHEMFLAQVELRLVSRVLSMSKLTTDQLLWCHKKINRINIIGRKVYIESSFLLFPC